MLTLIQRGMGDAYDALVSRLRTAADAVYIAVVSFEEQMRGWLAYVAKRRDPNDLAVAYGKLQALSADFAGRPMLAFDDSAATVLAEIRRSRTRIGEMDLRIAAIAISRNATLVTRNVAHFGRVADLNAQDWTRHAPPAE